MMDYVVTLVAAIVIAALTVIGLNWISRNV